MTTKWALVPAVATPEMERAAFYVLEVDATRTEFDTGTDARNGVFAAMLTASPGADLLERIVMALNLHAVNLANDGFTQAAHDVEAMLDELGASEG